MDVSEHKRSKSADGKKRKIKSETDGEEDVKDVKPIVKKEEHGQRKKFERPKASSLNAQGSDELKPTVQVYDALDKKAMNAYQRGALPSAKAGRGLVAKAKIQSYRSKVDEAASMNVRSEKILSEQPGYIRRESKEEAEVNIFELTQAQIVKMVDMRTAKKRFDLKLTQTGGSFIDYSRSGNDLLIATEKGQLSRIKWKTGQLMFERQLGTLIRDVHFFHNENLFAAVHKGAVGVYDQHGVQIRTIEASKFYPRFIDFLPHHMLLAIAGDNGTVMWQDVTTVLPVGQASNHENPNCTSFCQDPMRGVVLVGHSTGSVSFMTPNQPDPAAQIQANEGAIKSMVVDPTGNYLVTAGADLRVRIWDIRNFKEIGGLTTGGHVTNLAISQRGLVSLTCGAKVEVWKDLFSSNVLTSIGEMTSKSRKARSMADVMYDRQADRRSHFSEDGTFLPYMRHFLPNDCRAIKAKFCPFEDILGVGHVAGFSSLIVPGSGEANIDSREVDIFENKKRRREREVRQLLEKIPHTMISLDPDFLGSVRTGKVEMSEIEKLKLKAAERMKKLSAKVENAKGKSILGDDVAREVRRQQNIERLMARREAAGEDEDDSEDEDSEEEDEAQEEEMEESAPAASAEDEDSGIPKSLSRFASKPSRFRGGEASSSSAPKWMNQKR